MKKVSFVLVALLALLLVLPVSAGTMVTWALAEETIEIDFVDEELKGFNSSSTYKVGLSATDESLVTIESVETYPLKGEGYDWFGQTLYIQDSNETQLFENGLYISPRSETPDSGTAIPVSYNAETPDGQITGLPVDLLGLEYATVSGETIGEPTGTITDGTITALSADDYVVRRKAVATVPASKEESEGTPEIPGRFASEYSATIKVLTRAETPAISLDYENEYLTNFTASTDYSIKVGDADATTIKSNENGKIKITDGWFNKSLSIVLPGNKSTTDDSAGQPLTITERGTAPTFDSNVKIDPVSFSDSDPVSDGKISGLTDTDLEYALLGSDNKPIEPWTACENGAAQSLVAGKYVFRHEASQSAFASNYSESISVLTKVATPTIVETDINYINATLPFTANAIYFIKIDGAEGDGKELTAIAGSIAIEDDWFDETISIVAKATSDTTANSDPKTLAIANRREAPTETDVTTKSATAVGENGSIDVAEGVDVVEYSATGETLAWNTISGGSAAVPAGSYVVRFQGNNSTKVFSSPTYPVTVGAATPAASLTIAPANTIAFGTLPVGAKVPDAVTITVTNSGNAAATITGVAFDFNSDDIDDEDWEDIFTITPDNDDATVAAKASEANGTKTWTIKPAAIETIGTYDGKVLVSYEGGEEPLEVSVTFSIVAATRVLTFDPDSATITAPEGYVTANYPSNMIKITNSGNSSATISKVDITSDDGATFYLSEDLLGKSIGADKSLSELYVTAKAGSTEDEYSGKITITYDDDETADLDITFTVTAEAPEIVFEPNTITFSAPEGYDPSDFRQTITIKNRGSADATNLSIDCDGEAFSEANFSIVNSEGTALILPDHFDADSSTSGLYVVAKEGLEAEEHTSTITITYNDGETATLDITFTVTETAPYLSVTSGSSVDLKTGVEGVYAPAVDHVATVTIKNIGTAKATDVTIAMDDGPSSDFDLSGFTMDSNGEIAIGEEITGTVKPIATLKADGSPYSANIVLSYDEGDDDVEIPVTFKVIDAYRFLAVEAVTFDTVKAPYSQPAAKPINIKNTGTVGATISDVSVSGSSYTIITSDVTAVGPGETNSSWKIQPKSGLSDPTHTETIIVTYDGNAQTDGAKVSFTINAADTPTPVNPGTGTGTGGGTPTTDPDPDPVATLSVTAPSFAQVAEGYIVQPNAQAITISNSGEGAAKITSVTVSPTDAFTIGGSGSAVAAKGSISTWTIQPALGLKQGTHTGTITVTYDGKTATGTVNFVVASSTTPYVAGGNTDEEHKPNADGGISFGTTLQNVPVGTVLDVDIVNDKGITVLSTQATTTALTKQAISRALTEEQIAILTSARARAVSLLVNLTPAQVAKLPVGTYKVMLSSKATTDVPALSATQIGTIVIPKPVTWKVLSAVEATAGFRYTIVSFTETDKPVLTVKASNPDAVTILEDNTVVGKLQPKAEDNVVTLTFEDADGNKKICTMTIVANRLAQESPLRISGKQGVFSSTKLMKYNGTTLEAEIFLLNKRKNKAIYKAGNLTLVIYEGGTPIFKKDLKTWRMTKALKYNGRAIYQASITAEELKKYGVSESMLNLASGRYQVVLQRSSNVTPVFPTSNNVVVQKEAEGKDLIVRSTGGNPNMMQGLDDMP